MFDIATVLLCRVMVKCGLLHVKLAKIYLGNSRLSLVGIIKFENISHNSFRTR